MSNVLDMTNQHCYYVAVIDTHAWLFWFYYFLLGNRRNLYDNYGKKKNVIEGVPKIA